MQLSTRLRRLRHIDAGFTLIELLIAVSILGVITVPLGNLMIEYFQNTTRTTVRLNESHDAQIAAAYFAQDVASTGIHSTTTPYTLLQSIDDTGAAGWPYPCSTAGSTPVLRLVWNEYGSGGTPTQIRVAYVTATVGSQHQLIRLRCSAGSSTPDRSNVLAHDINAGVAPTVACYVNSVSTTTPTACVGADALVPNEIVATLSMLDPLDSGTAYSIKLTGQRRQT
jgi:prepilin-type N-terminal cleavage/methylation domain-containing protein